MSDTATMVAVLVAGAAVTMVAVSMYTSTVPQLGTQKESQKDSWWSQWHLTGSVFDNVLTQTVKQFMGPRANEGLENACAQCKKSNTTKPSSVTKNPITDGGVLTGTVLRKGPDPVDSENFHAHFGANEKYEQYSDMWKLQHPEWKEQGTKDGYM